MIEFRTGVKTPIQERSDPYQRGARFRAGSYSRSDTSLAPQGLQTPRVYRGAPADDEDREVPDDSDGSEDPDDTDDSNEGAEDGGWDDWD